MPFELLRWDLAEQFKWSLEYVDSLSLKEIEEYMQIRDGRGKAQETNAWRNKRKR